MTAPTNQCHIQLTSHCAIAPTFPLVKVFSEIFASLCDSSDKRFVDHPSAMKMHLSVAGAHFFEAGEIPGISIAQYVDRIHTYSQCPPECFIVSLIFIDRLIAVHKGFAIHSKNFHRLFLTSTMMSTKFFEDTYYNNAFWAKVGGVSLPELNHMEVQFLRMIDFQMSIPLELYDQYFAELVYFAEREKIILPEEAVEFRSVPQPLPPPFEHGVPPVAYSAVAAVHPVHQVASHFKSPILRALPETKYPSAPSLAAPVAASAGAASTSAKRGRRRPRRRGRRVRVLVEAPAQPPAIAENEPEPEPEPAELSQRAVTVCSAFSSPLRIQDLRATPTHSDRSLSPSTFQSQLDSARQSPSDLQVLSNMGLQSPIKDEDDPMPTPSYSSYSSRPDKRRSEGLAFCKEHTTPHFSYAAAAHAEKRDVDFVPIAGGPGANLNSVSHLAEMPTAGSRYLEDDSKPIDISSAGSHFPGFDGTQFNFPSQYFSGAHAAPALFTAEPPMPSAYPFAYHSASLPVAIPGAAAQSHAAASSSSSSSAPLPTSGSSLKFSPPEASCNMQARFQMAFPLSGPLFQRFGSESAHEPDHDVGSAFGSPPSDDSPVANISLY